MFNTNVTGFDVGVWILSKHVKCFIKNLKYFQKAGQFFNLRVAPPDGGIWNLYFLFLRNGVYTLFLVHNTIKGTLGFGLKFGPKTFSIKRVFLCYFCCLDTTFKKVLGVTYGPHFWATQTVKIMMEPAPYTLPW